MTKGEFGEVQSPEERRTVKEPRRSVASSAWNGAAVALRARSSEALRSSSPREPQGAAAAAAGRAGLLELVVRSR